MTELSQLFSSPARIDVLETLFHQPGEVGLRQIARISGLHLRSVQLALKSLQADHLIRRRKSGARVFFKLNREHPTQELLTTIFRAAESHRIKARAETLQSRGKEVMAFVTASLRVMNRARKSHQQS